MADSSGMKPVIQPVPEPPENISRNGLKNSTSNLRWYFLRILRRDPLFFECIFYSVNKRCTRSIRGWKYVFKTFRSLLCLQFYLSYILPAGAASMGRIPNAV